MVHQRQLVENPVAFTPLPYGLLTVAQLPTPPSHWANGVTYETNCLRTGNTTYDECIAVTGTGSPPPPPAKANTTELDVRGATAFTVFTKFDCSPVGRTNGEAQKIATDAINQSAPWQVERSFWTGRAAGQEVVFPHLADNTQVLDAQGVLLQSIPVTGAGPMDIARGLGFLEEELANCYNGEGVIHIPRNVLATMQAWQLVEARGPQLRTKNGNLVAVGSGYPGTGPNGQAPAAGNEWIFATGAVFAYHGGVFISEIKDSFNKAENTVEMLAERTYVLGWDCCHAAVEVITGVPIPV